MPLNLAPNTADPDGVFQLIVDMHAGLDEAESAAANARLILLLANHIGDAAVIAEATRIAREGVAVRTPADGSNASSAAGAPDT